MQKQKPINHKDKTFKCAFCDKKFINAVAAKMHEETYHKKTLKKMMELASQNGEMK